jgi:diketogulonate reductase-like aldo/keto reductase
MTLHIELRTGATLSVLGLGTWKAPKDACAQLVQDAVLAGYRHFDCACDYGNEAQVGNAPMIVTPARRAKAKELSFQGFGVITIGEDLSVTIARRQID